MRAATTLLIVLLTAANVGAATRSPAGAAGLRGPVSASDTEHVSPAAGAPPARLRKVGGPAPLLASPLPADAGQCRLTCAHAYYRCLAGDYAEQCPQAWTLCRADCARTAAALR